MNVVYGDLLLLAKQGDFDVIIHGCNCFCSMEAGIAKSMKQHFPEAYVADYHTLTGDRNKLGSYTTATIEHNNISFTVVNAYTQYDWRGKGCKADYAAIRTAFTKVKAEFSGLRIGYPLIGAGLAGGDWAIISQIIEETLYGEQHTLVKLISGRVAGLSDEK